MHCFACRHPRPLGHEGRCIGRHDLRLDPRKARRLARRLHRLATRGGWPRVVCTSPLRRCRDVGRHLRRLGWRHLVDAALLEADFGDWEGRLWDDIGRAEVDAWVSDFANHAPGGGESLRQVLQRAANWQPPVAGAMVVAHAGWMQARRWADQHGAHRPPARAADWPRSAAYGEIWSLPGTSATPASLARSSP